ncbi:MAG: hypothetical protein WDN26_19565 [Chitinophagaceae bacterium]
MKLPAGQAPLYSGKVSTESFQLGSFIGDPALGAIAIDGAVKGRGFNDKDRQAELDGKNKIR